VDIRSLRKINSFSKLKNALRYFLFLIGRKTYVKFGSKSITINVAELFFQEHDGQEAIGSLALDLNFITPSAYVE
jgi:hypothetical protein